MENNRVVEELLGIINGLKKGVLDIFPNLVAAVVISALGYLIARLVKAVTIRFINKVHLLFPGQSIRLRVRGFLEEHPIDRAAGNILFWVLLVIFLTAATETLGLPVVTTWLSGIADYLPKILSAFLIGIAGLIAGMVLRDIITSTTVSAGIAYGHVIGKLVQTAVILVTVLIGIELIGIDVSLLESVFTIVVGAVLFGAAFAFGYGAKASVSNILASYYVQKLYKAGDNVRIGDIEGRIIEITPVSVILESPQGKICIPAQTFNEERSVLLLTGGRDEQ